MSGLANGPVGKGGAFFVRVLRWSVQNGAKDRIGVEKVES